MPTAHAHIDTERASRYLTQFCKHASAMGGARGHGPIGHLRDMLTRRDVEVHAEWSDTRGEVTFIPWGTCVITAGATGLSVSVEAAGDQNLRRIQDVVTRNFERFGKRDRLTVTWERQDVPTVTSGEGESQPA